MINTLISIASTLLLWLNLLGLGLILARWIPTYILARAVAPGAVALTLFFVEHFVGLGSLRWMWPITSILAALLAFRQIETIRNHWRVELLFALAFGYCLVWRVGFPDLAPSSEKIADLALISSYLPGVRLPPVDAWLPPYPLDVYYSFQHYAAALMARTLDLSPGLAYNLAVSVVCGWTLASGIAAAYLFAGRRRIAALPALALAVGGPGVSLLLPWLVDSPRLHDSMRFIGGAASSARMTPPLGRKLAEIAGGEIAQPLELPFETLSYLIALGDYHPPLSGFFLLALALLAVAVSEERPKRVAPQAVIAAAAVAPMISNAWSLPLQAGLTASWCAYRVAVRKPPNWKAVAAAISGALLLCSPFLAAFAENAAAYGSALRLTAALDHSPPLLTLLVLFPVLAILVLSFVFERRPLALAFTLALSAAFLASEVIYIDDVYTGKFNRFNTTLKWWPWLQTAVLISVASLNLRSSSRVARYGTAAFLLISSSYGVHLAHHYWTTPKPALGSLEGDHWLRQDSAKGAVLAYLRTRPRGIALQRVEAAAFTSSPALVLLGGQHAFLGWPAHENLWRAKLPEVNLRRDRVASFYRGELDDSRDWLRRNHITDIVWLPEYDDAAKAFDRIALALEDSYSWTPLYENGDSRAGVWSRRR